MAREKPISLIVNADDLGIHPSTNHGILEAARRGIVSSTSILVTTNYWKEAAIEGMAIPGLGIGIHLNLTMGTPVLPPEQVPDLVNEAGEFLFSNASLVTRFHLPGAKSALLEQIGREFEAQILRLQKVGVEVTHMDSHQHVHMIPSIFSAALEAGKKCGVNKIRYVKEPFFAMAKAAGIVAMLKAWAPFKFAYMRKNGWLIRNDLKSPDLFLGLLLSGEWNPTLFRRALQECAKLSNCESLEISIHPGHPVISKETIYAGKPFDPWLTSENRRQELEAVLDPVARELLGQLGFKLISYRNL